MRALNGGKACWLGGIPDDGAADWAIDGVREPKAGRSCAGCHPYGVPTRRHSYHFAAAT